MSHSVQELELVDPETTLEYFFSEFLGTEGLRTYVRMVWCTQNGDEIVRPFLFLSMRRLFGAAAATIH